ncbi:MAG: aminoacyl-tRNA hydrolase [Gammaproteobacteria bacterium]|nr:aminoacyl-tRNA hydrolase [Gammaproteobacteria bacterium]MCY4210738.1 aminoacyl-tRNA hydrolase [Gammaproteobacteria bacterium]
MRAELKLIAGLGNPGTDYTATRHNAGFWFVDRLAAAHQVRFAAEKKFFGELARINTPAVDCLLLKPTTFMNNSGRALHAVADYYRIELPRILVVHDEIDLDAGVIRLKKSGGHGGHKGLIDISEKLGGRNYLRLRIGVSHPGDKSRVLAHVLGRPAREDATQIEQALQSGLEIMPLLFAGELEKAMHRLHSREQPATND